MPRRSPTSRAQPNRRYRDQLIYADLSIEYQVVHSPRRSLALHLHADGALEVRAPQRLSAQQVSQWVQSKAGWIHKKLGEQQQQRQHYPTPQLSDGGHHYFLGKTIGLQLGPNHSGAPQFDGETLTLAAAHSASTDVDEHLLKQVNTWFRAQAKDYFSQRYDACWPAFEQRGHQRPGLRLRSMKTLWGSLARRQMMTLNTKLIHTPTVLIDYVIIHELCHLEHHNHGPGFQQLMDRMCPPWREHKAQLKHWML